MVVRFSANSLASCGANIATIDENCGRDAIRARRVRWFKLGEDIFYSIALFTMMSEIDNTSA